MIKDIFKQCRKPIKLRACEKSTSASSIVLEDEPSVPLNIGNSKKWCVYKIKLDGCMISRSDSSTKRCDWLLYKGNNDRGVLLLIELKSTNLSRDIADQFSDTINYINNNTDNSLILYPQIKQKNILIYKKGKYSGEQRVIKRAKRLEIEIEFIPCPSNKNSVDISIEDLFKINKSSKPTSP